MKKLCKNCTHWKTNSALPAGWGWCQITHTFDGRKRHEGGKAHAIAQDICDAWLETRDDFGCVQFEAKE